MSITPEIRAGLPARPEDIIEPPNHYHRVERSSGRTEVYPTDRLFRKCIAVTWLYALMLLLPCVVTLGGIMVACVTLPNALQVAGTLLAILAPVAALMLVIWSMDRQARRACSIPLIIGDRGAGGRISYREDLIASAEEVAGVRVLRLVYEEGPDHYSVGLVSPASVCRVLPKGLPVTWWFGTGQGYFGRWHDRAVADLLARDLALILGRPLLGEQEVRVG